MASRVLNSSSISAFCESVAVMLAAGIQTDEAIWMLGDNMEDRTFKRACDSVYASLIEGDTLAQAMAVSGAFPRYAVDMVAVGERSGRLESVLRSLSVYYDEEDRIFDKIRSSVGYPAALLCIMSVIMFFTILFILPVFVNVYDELSGSLTAGSFNMVAIAIGIGYAALAITLIITVLVLLVFIASKTKGGNRKVIAIFEHLPFTRGAMEQLALSRFTAALSTYTASGLNTDDAMREALGTVDNIKLNAHLQLTYGLMVDPTAPRSLAQAITETRVFDSMYARLLTIGSRSGGLSDALDSLSDNFFREAISRIDRIIDNIEPALAAFLTVAVGATLISVMLPLIGIMGSIG